jgi:endonuclease YncB( thermonuclease family)
MSVAATAPKEYVYEGYVERVVDGDTFDAIVGLWSWKIPAPVAIFSGSSSVVRDLGFHCHVLFEMSPSGISVSVEVHERFRMFGINAPEVTGASKVKGLEASQWLKDKVEGQHVVLNTKKSTEKYGRWLATVMLEGQTESLNDQMVQVGHAVVYVP